MCHGVRRTPAELHASALALLALAVVVSCLGALLSVFQANSPVYAPGLCQGSIVSVYMFLTPVGEPR